MALAFWNNFLATHAIEYMMYGYDITYNVHIAGTNEPKNVLNKSSKEGNISNSASNMSPYVIYCQVHVAAKAMW